MIKVYIREPIWHNRSVGVNKKIIKDDLLIEILHMKIDGKRTYPYQYYISKKRALAYPEQTVRNKVVLKIIPIEELRILSDEETKRADYYTSQGIPFTIKQ